MKGITLAVALVFSANVLADSVTIDLNEFEKNVANLLADDALKNFQKLNELGKYASKASTDVEKRVVFDATVCFAKGMGSNSEIKSFDFYACD